jgi:hypothetical protein
MVVGMPWKWIEGVQRSTGKVISGWDWKPSYKYRDEKDQLASMMNEYIAEKDQQFKDLGYYTTGRALPKIEDWLDDTIDHYRYNGQTWWQRNWFPMIMLLMMGGSMLVIGLVNGWS